MTNFRLEKYSQLDLALAGLKKVHGLSTGFVISAVTFQAACVISRAIIYLMYENNIIQQNTNK